MYHSFKRTISIESIATLQNKEKSIWRSTSLSNIVKHSRIKSDSSVLTSRDSNSEQDDGMNSINLNTVSVHPVTTRKLEYKLSDINRNSIVTIVVVEAKDMPPVPGDGVTHNLYCKFRLGSECYKTKAVTSTIHPNWGERFIMRSLHTDNLLKVSVWEKGKQKNFMGSCVLDLSSFERERTHEIWQELDGGYGQIHLSITICLSGTNNSSLSNSNLFIYKDVEHLKYIIYDLRRDWQLVGSLHVNVLGARGLVGRSSAYCILELDNERVQTPKGESNTEPIWNKCYEFGVYDVTSTLYLKMYGRSFTSALLYEPIGKVSIPLLTIINGEKRWYALKDKHNRYTAKGNYPRVELQMTLVWNPIKASLKLFRPKPVKYVKKPKKYDVTLMHSNIEFVGKTFEFLYEINESFKRLFEWDDPEYSLIVLFGWVLFCHFLRLWTVPLLLLVPFTYYWFGYRSQGNKHKYSRSFTHTINEDIKNSKKEKSFSGKLQDLQHTTLVVTNGVEYIASVAERLYNLVSFKVPYLSYLTMILLAISSLVIYCVPFNYLLMILGIYKYARKHLNPHRVLNNDLIDFLSRIPDNKVLEDWKELSVPEPIQKQFSGKLARSISTEVLKQQE